MTTSESAAQAVAYPEKCFACDRKLTPSEWYYKAQTIDGQTVYVESECYDRVRKAKQEGYQPPLGGPRLFTLDTNLE